MMGNGYGNTKMSRDRIMREHDALPKGARLLSCYTVANWAPDSLHGFWRAASDGARSPAEQIRLAAAMIRAEEGVDTFEGYGPEHPECPNRLKGKTPPARAWWRKRGARHAG